MNYEDIEAKDKLEMTIKFLDKFYTEFKETINPYNGDKFKAGNFSKFFGDPKTKIVEKDEESERIAKELEQADWYVLDSFYGTSEEIGLVNFIKETIGNLEDKYEEYYLLRNEEIYKIYDFDKGRGFQPDFLLFLKEKNNINLYYQVFVESKGDQYIGHDDTFKTGKEGWKEEFLEEISKRYGHGKSIKAENKDYKLIGLPFFNKAHNNNFVEKYNLLLD